MPSIGDAPWRRSGLSVVVLLVAIALGCGDAALPTRQQPVRAPAEVGLLVSMTMPSPSSALDFAATSDLSVLRCSTRSSTARAPAVATALSELRAVPPSAAKVN